MGGLQPCVREWARTWWRIVSGWWRSWHCILKCGFGFKYLSLILAIKGILGKTYKWILRIQSNLVLWFLSWETKIGTKHLWFVFYTTNITSSSRCFEIFLVRSTININYTNNHKNKHDNLEKVNRNDDLKHTNDKKKI